MTEFDKALAALTFDGGVIYLAGAPLYGGTPDKPGKQGVNIDGQFSIADLQKIITVMAEFPA